MQLRMGPDKFVACPGLASLDSGPFFLPGLGRSTAENIPKFLSGESTGHRGRVTAQVTLLDDGRRAKFTVSSELCSWQRAVFLFFLYDVA